MDWDYYYYCSRTEKINSLLDKVATWGVVKVSYQGDGFAYSPDEELMA